MTRIVKTGAEARESLKRGIDLAADCVKVTLGPTGRNAVLGRLNLPPTITNDGVSVARNIEAEDPFENQGVWIVKEAASLADIKAGDGTTTTTVLLQKIVADVFDQLKDDGNLLKGKKVDTIHLKRQVDEARELVVAKLWEKKKDITEADIRKVAKVSGEYDWIADMLSEIYTKIGKDGYVELEEGPKTMWASFQGIEIPAGYQSEYYINNENRECVLKNPYVLVTNQPFEVTAILPVIEAIGKKAEATGEAPDALVLIAPDFSKDLLNRLITTKLKAKFDAVAIRLPQTSDDIYKDIASLVPTKFLDKNVFTKYEDFAKEFKLENLGQIEKAVIGEGYTRLIGGSGDTKDRIATLKKMHDESNSEFDKDKLRKRIASLGGGMAVIKVGGDSEFEKNYYKLKVEDAVNAVKVALKSGVVKGGGLALKEIADELPPNILSGALRAPYEQIQENSGGIDVGDDIIDPIETVISSLQSACSLAGMVITTEVLSVHKVEDKTKNFDGPEN